MSKELKSQLLADQSEMTPSVVYTDEEKTYLGGLQRKLVRARDARDQVRVEFDSMTYVQYCEANRKNANSYIQPRQNREDTSYQSGTIRQKMMAILASVNGLDLTPDVNVYDKDNIEMAGFGQSLEDTIWKTEELDGDEEKKLLRQYTLMEQGTVFVNEDWIEKVGVRKDITTPFDGKRAKWGHKLEKVFEGCSREIIQNEKVYLGDITQFSMSNQPYIFTVEIMPYSVAKQIYGEWDRWQYVDKRRKRFMSSESGENTLYNSNWLLTQVEDEQVEVIKYQDKPSNEYQIIINSIPMLPIGFPMPWKHGEYSLAKQVFSIISPHFAYGKSFPAVSRLQVAVWDEMLRLMVLKTQKSFKPPLGNLTGRVLSSRIMMPGVVSHGIDPDQIKLMDPEGSRGLTNAEAAALEIIRNNIDQITVNPTFSGQQPGGSPTATQIIEVQRQARMVIGLVVFVCSMLEKKLGELRLMNILEHWFDPVDETVNEGRTALVNKFRSFSRKVPVSGASLGQRINRVTETPKSAFALFKEEEAISDETGIATRIIELNTDVIRKTKYLFYLTIVPREKRSSPTSKLMFREMLADIQLFERPDQGIQPDWGYLGERFATNWEENSEKIFKRADSQQVQQQMQQQAQLEAQGQGTRTASPVETRRPRVNLNVGLNQ
jgi:hypothetical protein